MRHKYYISLLIALFPITCLSQNERKDSIPFEKNLSDSIDRRIVGNPEITIPAVSFSDHPRMRNPSIAPLFPYTSVNRLNLQDPDFNFTPGQTSIFRWNNGAILATGAMTQLPGMMNIESGTLGIYQALGNFTLNAGGIVNKYGYFNGLHTQYGLNLSINYQFSTRLSATLFGEHYFGQPPGMDYGTPMSPGMIGYYGRSSYGGYFDFQINEHWGVQTGVQTVQQVGTNKFQAEPIVTPYYRINKKVAIGLPVGQILYHILRK